ncbi:MAG: FliH/SctL family protein [Candidatus Latescibacterota bacterium]|nr:FliH/SctL family protein [Candidatus Latescibacterota bacterium]
MSKVIRTSVVTGAGVITLGRADEVLIMTPEEEAASPDTDLQSLLNVHAERMQKSVEEEWEGRLRQEHDAMRTAAERQQAELQEQHQQEVERLHQERYDEGHRDGVASKEQEVCDAVDRMAALHETLKSERAQVITDAEALVVDLAIAVARRITGVQAQLDPRIVARSIRQALEHLRERS